MHTDAGGPVDNQKLFAEIKGLSDRVKVLEATTKDLNTIIQGSESLRLKGLTERVEKVEATAERIIDGRQRERDKLKGIQIGLGLTGATGLVTLVTLISQIFAS